MDSLEVMQPGFCGGLCCQGAHREENAQSKERLKSRERRLVIPSGPRPRPPHQPH